jgi:hypothetical protein
MPAKLRRIQLLLNSRCAASARPAAVFPYVRPSCRVVEPPRMRGIALAADQFLDERLRSFRTALSIGSNQLSKKLGISPSRSCEGVFVMTSVRLWYLIRRSNAGWFGADHFGDSATFNSNQSCDGPPQYGPACCSLFDQFRTMRSVWQARARGCRRRPHEMHERRSRARQLRHQGLC